ncbi:MAG: hypothetical protein JXB04_07890, partial [Kiritimatiellae bacterium]|nr:hypothetical protein [Kiritimatiellia bacterium]
MSPCPSQRRHGETRAGLTLLETLLAVSIAALVIALVYTSYHAAMSTLAGQQKRRAGRSAAVHALNAVARDLTCGLDAAGGGENPFTLVAETMGSEPFASVSFSSAVRPEGEDALEWFEVQRVTFRVAEDGRARHLLREYEPLAGPVAGTVQTNLLLEQVASFRVEAFDGE